MDVLQRLSVSHRASQARLAEALSTLLLRAYRRSIDPSSVFRDAIVDQWIAEMIPLIRDFQRRSALASQLYYRQVRAIGAPDAPPLPSIDLPAVDEEAIATSLRVTGVIGLVEALKTLAAEEALEQSAKLAAGSAERHALDGGRGYLSGVHQADTVRVGAYRITRPGCCSFCAMLASRGAVYASDSFDASDPRFEGDEGGSRVKVHDFDRCTLGFVFENQGQVPAFNTQMTKLWEDTTKGLSGKDARNAFRRAYEALP